MWSIIFCISSMDGPEEPWILCEVLSLILWVDWLGLEILDKAPRGFDMFIFGALFLGGDCGGGIFGIGWEGGLEGWKKVWPSPSQSSRFVKPKLGSRGGVQYCILLPPNGCEGGVCKLKVLGIWDGVGWDGFTTLWEGGGT